MKNAIMMVDVAVEARRSENLNSYDAIFRGCMLRFRPILMTTAAAILGAAPLAMSLGDGGEIRRPLGIAIVGEACNCQSVDNALHHAGSLSFYGTPDPSIFAPTALAFRLILARLKDQSRHRNMHIVWKRKEAASP